MEFENIQVLPAAEYVSLTRAIVERGGIIGPEGFKPESKDNKSNLVDLKHYLRSIGPSRPYRSDPNAVLTLQEEQNLYLFPYNDPKYCCWDCTGLLKLVLWGVDWTRDQNVSFVDPSPTTPMSYFCCCGTSEADEFLSRKQELSSRGFKVQRVVCE